MARLYTKEDIIHRCIASEGGYVNDPDDPGGATCYGITERVARANGYGGNMRHLSAEEAQRIYGLLYWDTQYLDEILKNAPKAAEMLFNWGVNAGVRRSAEEFQETLNAFNYNNRYGKPLIADGVIGRKTMTAFNEFINHRGKKGAYVLAMTLLSRRISFYQDLGRNPTRRKYMYGWINRTLHEAGLC